MVKKVFHEIFRRENLSDFFYIILGCIVQAVGMETPEKEADMEEAAAVETPAEEEQHE